MKRRTAVAGTILALGTCVIATTQAQVTDLTVSKSGDDVVLSWTGSGTVYDGARATDARFANATTQFIGLAGQSYTYVGAVSNPRSLEFFDVTDETGGNRGGNWNGGVLPPLPPAIDTGDPSTNIGGLFIGSPGVISGSGFSSIPEVNTVCFEGGVCTQATSSSPSQIQFVTPPGAYTGALTVTVGSRTSEPATAVVALDDPADWSIREIFMYSPQDRSYWIKGRADGISSLYRVFFNASTQRWSREDRGGSLFFTTCSAQTSPTGRIFCAGTPRLGETETRIIDTSPPATVADCIPIEAQSSFSFIVITSSAADPNPDGLRTNAAYFATNEGDTRPSRIRKVSHDCGAILDDNYGNFGTTLGAKNNSMVVDPSNGDLYFADDGEIWRVTTTEAVSRVRTGLATDTKLASLSREGIGDPGTLLLISGGSVQALALDNLNADPMPVASGTAAGFAAQVSGGPWLDSNVNRTVTVHRDGTALILGAHPLIAVTDNGPFQVRISSPKTKDEEQLPLGQSGVRLSDADDTGHSHAITRLQYRDGIARTTCATVGDPGPGAPQYDPSPTTPSDCNKPRVSALAICDNVDDVDSDGPFSFVGSGGLVSCKTCGSTEVPCSWEFRITNRYAGDNYKVYFAFDEDAEQFAATSDIYTAWKHIHIEQDRMFQKGGLLSQSFDPAACSPNCDEITVWDWTNIDSGNITIAVFDCGSTYEAAEERVVVGSQSNPDGTRTLFLDADLAQEYIASPYPEFQSGASAGIGQVRDAASVACDPCYFEPDLSSLESAFDDALTSYHITDYGLEGAGTIPFVPEFDLTEAPDVGTIASLRFHQIWFSNKDAKECPVFTQVCADCCNEQQNYFHAMGARKRDNSDVGNSVNASDISWTWVKSCEDDCSSCTPEEFGKYIRRNGIHEFGHQFVVNRCIPTEHDENIAWCLQCGDSTDEKCVMNSEMDVLPDRIDGIDRLCCYNLIRNEEFCSDTTECGEGIRVTVDPR